MEASLASLEAPLENSLRADPHSLSAALQQCLLLASLIRSGANFLILDESMAYLDGRTRRDFARTLLELVKSGCTVLLVSHQEEFLELAGRVVFMERGEKIFDGTTEQFQSQYFERAGFRKDSDSAGLIARLPEFKPGEFDGVEVIAGSRTFNLRAASSLVLGGFSGSGTSTALNSLMGLEERDFWRCSGQRDKSCLLRQNVGPSFWRSTCAEELKASRGAHQPLPHSLEEAVLNSVPAGWLEKAPWHLSHGQLRFFGASCLLLQNPQVLYLDHPFQGLDGTLREKLQYSLSEYLKGGGRVVLTTHWPEKVRRLGHQVLWLEGGSLFYAGLSAENGWDSLSASLSSDSLLPGPIEENRVEVDHG
jgi:ABC-type sulfate/molybdate transport systems ATPase subunit